MICEAGLKTPTAAGAVSRYKAVAAASGSGSDRTISPCRSRLLEKVEMTTNAALRQYALSKKLVE
jgi:hypothetical protein